MTEQNQRELTEEQLAERKERFRYTDLSHPVMQVLFNMQLDLPKSIPSQ